METKEPYRPENKVLQMLGSSRESIKDTCQRLNMYPAAVPAVIQPAKLSKNARTKKPALAPDHVG